MLLTSRYILCCFFLLIAGTGVAFSQAGFYVPAAGKIFFTGDSSTIFSNVTNNGNLGIGKNATVNFKGKNWSNSSHSQITDESNQGSGTSGEGGWLRFMGDSMRQQISGGYNAATKSGPSFGNIRIDNNMGVELLDGSAKTRKQIDFQKGLFFLHDYIFAVGNNDPGRISGYDSARYFVTGNGPSKGLLIRENIRKRHGNVDFPIGTVAHAYTPARLHNQRIYGDDYYVTVFDSVKQDGVSGTVMASESVNKTWQVGKRNTSIIGNLEISLQHQLANEGSAFAGNRKFAYLSQYTAAGWDLGMPQHTPGKGTVTTGAALENAGLNERVFTSFLSTEALFTKFAGNGATTDTTKLWFNAYRLDSSLVRVYWYTKPEVNIRQFVVERMLSNETQFKPVDTVASSAINGYSPNRLDYFINDPNNYRGVSFYRLRMISYNSNFKFSDTVAVNGEPGLYSIFLWPNPAPQYFFLSIHKTLPAKAVVVYNAIGQRVAYQEVKGRNILRFDIPIQGTYFVSIILTNGTFIETRKVVVAGR